MLLDLPAQAKSWRGSSLPVLSTPICFRGVGSCPTRRERQGPLVASVQRLSQVQSVTCQQVGEGVSETTEPVPLEPGTQRGQMTFSKPHSEVANCPHSAEHRALHRAKSRERRRGSPPIPASLEAGSPESAPYSSTKPHFLAAQAPAAPQDLRQPHLCTPRSLPWTRRQCTLEFGALETPPHQPPACPSPPVCHPSPAGLHPHPPTGLRQAESPLQPHWLIGAPAPACGLKTGAEPASHLVFIKAPDTAGYRPGPAHAGSSPPWGPKTATGQRERLAVQRTAPGTRGWRLQGLAHRAPRVRTPPHGPRSRYIRLQGGWGMLGDSGLHTVPREGLGGERTAGGDLPGAGQQVVLLEKG